MNWTPGRKREGKTEEKLAGDHWRGPARIGTDVGRCSRRSGGQRWRKRIARCAVQHGKDYRSKVRSKDLSNCFLNSLNSLLIYLLTYSDYNYDIFIFVNFLILTACNIHCTTV